MKQKVITIHTPNTSWERGTKFDELEFPKIDKYLNEGYQVKQVIPVVTNGDNSSYSLTFILEKA